MWPMVQVASGIRDPGCSRGLENLFKPFTTTKQSGMVSAIDQRTIVELMAERFGQSLFQAKAPPSTSLADY
jgi:hypothetical protein